MVSSFFKHQFLGILRVKEVINFSLLCVSDTCSYILYLLPWLHHYLLSTNFWEFCQSKTHDSTYTCPCTKSTCQKITKHRGIRYLHILVLCTIRHTAIWYSIILCRTKFVSINECLKDCDSSIVLAQELIIIL